MAELTAAECAGAFLERERAALAEAVTAALYEARPDLTQRYGDAGRAKCLQDMIYNLEHLAPAVSLRVPEMYADYILWVARVLVSRGVPADELALSVRLTREVLEGRLQPDELAAVDAVLQEAGERLQATRGSI